MSGAPETLDDLIDRVAADLTRVPLDAGYGERLVLHLDRTPRPTPVWATAAAAMMAVVAITLWWAPHAGREPSVSRVGEPRLEDRQPFAARDPREAAAPAVGRPLQPAVAPVVSRPVLARRVRATPGPSIPALETPALLALDELAMEALSVPAVDIERLDISMLAIEAMESVPDSKEYP
jgi:hypothetical protein